VNPLQIDEIIGLNAYAPRRDQFRKAIIAHKAERRVAVGENVTLVFEDRETLRFQIQEMLWIERITGPGGVQKELDVYNELMPGERELSATLFIEITDMAKIRPALDRLIGLDEHVSVEIGERGHTERVPARFDEKQMEGDRIAAVQYVRFKFDEAQAKRFQDEAVPARIRIDHPNYRHSTEFSPSVRSSLARGLFEAPEPLIHIDAKAQSTESNVLAEAERVRAVHPKNPRAPGHVVVEPIKPVGSLLDVDPQLEQELFQMVKRIAREVVQAHGSCRIHCDIGGIEPRLRWHIYPVTT
jgi:hypothetical protein